jgi:N-formylglutamate amidohydrolase
MDNYKIQTGNRPIIISIPHCGLFVPDELAARMTDEALTLPDTDWHIPELLDFAPDLDVTILQSNISRYVVDLNRPPDDTPLYKGATTGLVSTITFDGNPIYKPGQELKETEQAERVARYWQPYHTQLQNEIGRNLDRHGFALLFDAHSIRSVVPRLFDGVLPDLNFGTNDGQSTGGRLIEGIIENCKEIGNYSIVRDARFKGGYITRHYGQPANGVEAVQLEMAQSNYMSESYPFDLISEKADDLRKLLKGVCQELIKYADMKSASIAANGNRG